MFIGVYQVFVGAQGIFAVLCRISWVAGQTLVVALQLSSCGIEAQLPFGVWDFSSLISDWTPNPTAQGGFLTTGPPGRSLKISFLKTEITSLICGVTSMYSWVHLPSHTVISTGFRHTTTAQSVSSHICRKHTLSPKLRLTHFKVMTVKLPSMPWESLTDSQLDFDTIFVVALGLLLMLSTDKI